MKTVIVFLVCLVLPLGASARMISFDQHVCDTSTVSCSFTKEDAGHIKLSIWWGTGEAQHTTSYLCEKKVDSWQDLVVYAKGLALYVGTTDHIDIKEILTQLGLPNFKEGN
ncbi:hypothetical protein [Desulfoluna spongiiphila]|uniref:Uncharacterized protein n=1 Tax=Desulfoluna spongiiphila TaxID=419481 RepID=A0A1G5DKP8_9BACT|nr:hypothetical protein [Desulfoluna spongiiphila]SCY14998.1 hypothetical protein SAMN05216233_104234 [Desulfoluna spongiiphila]VVS95090.1 hypothetical protein DBB_46670 [Desulfoluna spongiiphila]